MSTYLFLFTMLAVASAEFSFPELGLTWPAPQIVPSGAYWPRFDTVAAPMTFLTNTSKCESFEGRIALIVIHSDYDETLIWLQECGAVGVAVLGGDSLFPGSSFRRMLNRRPFTSREAVFPVVELLPGHGRLALQYWTNATRETPPRILTAELVAEPNVWRDITYSAYMAIPIVCGSLSLATVVVSFINLIMARQLQHPTVAYKINSFLFVGCLISVVGFVDFNGFWQLYPSRFAVWVSNAGIGIIMAAPWYLLVLMMNISRRTVERRLIRRCDDWIFNVIAGLRAALDIIMGAMITLDITSRDIGYAVGLTWTIATAAADWTLAALYITAFVRFVKAYKHSANFRGEKHTSRLKNIVIKNTVTAGLIFFYGFISVIAWGGFAGYPDRSMLFYFVQPAILRACAFHMALASHMDTRTALHLSTSSELKSTPMNSTNVVTNTDTDGGTAEMEAVPQD